MRITIATRLTNRGGVTDVVAQEPVVERRERCEQPQKALRQAREAIKR